MRTIRQQTGRALALLLAGAALASCMAHGQGRQLDPKIYVNYSPYSEAFYRELMTGRVNVFEGLGSYRNVVSGGVFASDGTLVECIAHRRLDNKLHWVGQSSTRWSIVRQRSGARIEWDKRGGHKRYASKFYDPETGAFDTEILSRGRWIVSNKAQIQNTWPRALADACPNLKLPDHIRINEKQTSLRMDELRRQDPEAPIQNFSGSHLTAPGRTGLGASRGAPTTTREEVWAFMQSQEGYVVTSRSGAGYVFSLEGEQSEVWRLDDEGRLAAYGALRTETDTGGQEWVIAESPGYPAFRYPVGYPFPLLPTGHRHAAWQLTDALIGGGEPVPLSWMGERYSGHRFLFHDKTITVVAPGDDYLEGRWAWTKGRLVVWVIGDEGNAGSIGWRELAAELGVQPAVWTPSTPDMR